MYAVCPTDRVRVSKERRFFVSGIQKASIRLGRKRLAPAYAYHTVLGVARPMRAQLSDKWNPIDVGEPIQSFLGPCVVSERRRCVGSSAPHSETRFIE